jgi:hypothetical protein
MYECDVDDVDVCDSDVEVDGHDVDDVCDVD